MPNTLDDYAALVRPLPLRRLPLRRLPSRWLRSLLPFLCLGAFFVFWAAPAHAQITLTLSGQARNFAEDQTIFSPAPTTTVNAIVLNASGWAVNWMKITIDGTTYNAVLGGQGGQYEGTVTWDTTTVPNPSEHSISATAEIQFQQEGGGGQILELSSTAPPPPQNWLPNTGYGDGRPADVIVANMQLQSLQFGGQNNLTLEQDATTPVPVPQLTWTQGNSQAPTIVAPAGYVMGSTPTMTLTLFPLTGGVTQGYTMTAAATPNTGDPAVTLKDTGTTPVPFSGSSFTVTSNNPLLNKVTTYFAEFTKLALWVQFTRTGLSPPPWGEVSVYAYNDGIQSSSFGNTLYATLTQPTAPMANPWVGVLDYSCNWANGDSSASAAAADVTKGLFFSQRFYYPGSTATKWFDTTTGNFKLTNFLSTSGYQSGNCQDVSDFLTICANSIGLNFDVTQYSDANLGFTTNPVCLIGSDPTQDYTYTTSSWNWHQIASPNGSMAVYDACAAQKYDLTNAAYRNPPCGWDLYGYWQTSPGLGLVASPNPDSPVNFTGYGFNGPYIFGVE